MPPTLEATIHETKAKIVAYSQRVEANRPKVQPAEMAAKDNGLVRLGIKKMVDNREVMARV